MEETENILCINCPNKETRDLLELFLAQGESYLYRSFNIDLKPDVYLDFVEIDFEIDPLVICLKFEGYNVKEFSDKLMELYKVSTNLCYFCKNQNYSGRYNRKGNMISSTVYSYWYGIYTMDTERFWNTIDTTFESFNNIESLVSSLYIGNMDQRDLQQVIQRFQDHKNLTFLNFAFQRM